MYYFIAQVCDLPKLVDSHMECLSTHSRFCSGFAFSAITLPVINIHMAIYMYMYLMSQYILTQNFEMPESSSHAQMVDTRPYVVVLVVFPTVLGTRLLTMHNIEQYFVHYILFPHLVVMYIGYESLLTFKGRRGNNMGIFFPL